jgi:hypothetical protein
MVDAAECPGAPPAVLASGRQIRQRAQVADMVISQDKLLRCCNIRPLVMNLPRAREGSVLRLKDTTVNIDNLRLWRGTVYDASKRRSTQLRRRTRRRRIQRIRSPGDGNWFRHLAMPKSIVITNPTAAQRQGRRDRDRTQQPRPDALLEALAAAKPY